jgi:hypothetical protein
MKFVNYPKPRSASYYEQCYQEFIEICHHEDGISAVYGAGSVTNPGISDLDFLLSINEQSSSLADFESRLSPQLQSMLAGGTILKIDADHFSQLKIIDDFPLQWLRGTKYQFTEYSNDLWEICRILDWLPERTYALEQWLFSEPHDVWRGLLLLKSLTVSLNKIDQLCDNDRFSSLTGAIHSFRRQWFQVYQPAQQLSRHIQEALLEGAKAMKIMADYMRSHCYIDIPPGAKWPRTLSIPGGPRWTFAGDTAFLFYFLAGQAVLSRGLITDRLRELLGTVDEQKVQQALHPQLADTLHQRMRYCNEVATFLRAHNIRRGLLKYGWLL